MLSEMYKLSSILFVPGALYELYLKSFDDQILV
jgi:hypothetical protein